MTLPQLPLRMQIRDGATFDSYYAGSNREAVSALRELVLSTSPGLYLFGASGTGKTHLLDAAVHAASRAGQAAAYVDDEALADDDVLAGVEACHLLAIDAPDSALRDRDACVRLLRCLDRRRVAGRPTVFAACSPSDRIDCALPDLRTRLAALPAWGLRDLDDVHRCNLLELRLRSRGLEIDAAALRFLMTRLPRDLTTLLGAVERLDAACLSAKRRRVSVPFAQRALHELLPPPTSRTPGTR